MRNSLTLLLLLLLTLAVHSCNGGRPEGVLNSKEMEALLYDYHLAQGMLAQRTDSAAFYANRYSEAVFEKHGVTRAQFDSSMVWYMANAEQLFQIYERLDERLEGEVKTHRAANKRRGGDANTDTIDIWDGRQDFLLTTALGAGRFTFQIDADSTFTEGDMLVWNFQTGWKYREGSKRAVAFLVLVYDNDSIATSTRALYRTGPESLTLRIGARPVKAVKGLIHQNTPLSNEPKLFSVTKMTLFRVHKKPLPTETEQK